MNLLLVLNWIKLRWGPCGWVVWSMEIVPSHPTWSLWVNKMKISGVWFWNIWCDPENWFPCVSKLETTLNLWKTRSLSMIGKTLIINIFGASKFWFLAKVLPVPEWVVIRFKKLIHFLLGDSLPLKGKKGKELYLSVLFIWRWSTNKGHCKLKLTINRNRVKWWFLRDQRLKVLALLLCLLPSMKGD